MTGWTKRKCKHAQLIVDGNECRTEEYLLHAQTNSLRQTIIKKNEQTSFEVISERWALVYNRELSPKDPDNIKT